MLVDKILAMLLDGRIVRAFNTGYEAVVGVMVDLADDWLRGLCPAYAIAAAGTDALAPEKAKALKVAAAVEVLGQLGLDSIIKDIIKQWLKAPASVRDGAILYANAGNSFKVAWDDPSLVNIGRTLTQLPAIYAYASSVIENVLNGNLDVQSTTDWAFGFADVTNSAVANLLDKWHLSPLADLTRKVGGPINRMTIENLDVPAKAVDDAWKHITSGDFDAIMIDMTGIPTIKAAITATIDTVGDVASAIGGAAESVASGAETVVSSGAKAVGNLVSSLGF